MSNTNVNILLIENSSIISARLATIIRQADGIQNIFFASDLDQVWQILLSNNIDVVVSGIQLSKAEILSLTDYKELVHPFTFIIFSQHTSVYNSLYASLQIDHFLDMAKDFETLPQIISAVAIKQNENPITTNILIPEEQVC